MLTIIPAALFGVMTLKAAVSYVSGVSLARVGQGVDQRSAGRDVRQGHALRLAQLNAMHSGQFAARFLNDAMLIRESVTRSMQGSVRDVLTIACLGVVMFIQDWPLALDAVHGACR